ncbi:metal-dependent hydrolase [Clostridium kluyveri]|uniref:Metal-dependent hydrolase n=2 Tax=Clostridium kluyveri TaxID=1534 RepID=A5F9N1_CLOK5|nr:metal-dependent hydrolase [Clostridium kluyveri]ABQ23638.1 conserved hypothetical protein [Clostridium kluyveri DSM 555]BAH08535.1 hypothetical protein CKR_P16 [Clostridium kluyveri NBRC 12016]
MTKKTHVAVGIAATLPIVMKCEPIAFIGLLGAVIPDWDIILGMKHRTTTHSLTALFISTIIITLLNHQVGLIWGLNYSIHLLLDSFTKMGVPLFYPFRKEYYGFKLIYTGKSEDLFICLLAIFFITCMYLY